MTVCRNILLIQMLIMILWVAGCGEDQENVELPPGNTQNTDNADNTTGNNGDNSGPIAIDLPDDELGIFQTGLTEFDNGRYQQALYAFGEQLDQYPSGRFAASAHLYKGRAHYELDQFQQAITDLQLVLDNYADSSEADTAQYFLGKSYHGLEQFDDARTAYTNVINAYPQSQWVDNAEYRIANSYYDENNYIQAIDLLTTYIQNRPDSAHIDSAHYFLGRSYQEKQPADFTAAEQHFLRVADTSTWYDNANYQIAKLPYDQNDYTAAITTLTAFVGNFPMSSNLDNATYFLGRSYQALQDWTLAAAQFNAVVNNHPDGNWMDDALYQLAKLEYDQAQLSNDPAEAFGFYNTTVEKLAVFETDTALAAGNRYDSAMYFIGRAYQEQANIALEAPADGAATLLATLASELTIDGLYDAARNQYQKVMALNTGWSDNAQYELAKTYYDAGNIFQSKADRLAKGVAVGDLTQEEQTQALTHYGMARNKLVSAVDSFEAFNGTDFADQSAADDIAYFLARTYQRVAEVDWENRRLDLNLVPTRQITYADAREKFAQVNTTNFPESAWLDNAVYQAAITYTDEAVYKLSFNTITTDEASLLFNNAIAALVEVINYNYAETDINKLHDNAAYHLGWVYHHAGVYTDEQSAFEYYLTNFEGISTIRDDTADAHISDISNNTLPTAEHPLTTAHVVTPFSGLTLP